MPRQVAGVAVEVLGLRDVAKLILGPLGSAIDVTLRRKEHRCAAEAFKLIQLSLVRCSTVSGESAHPGATREAVQTAGQPEKEGSARLAGAEGSQSVNSAAKAAIAALRNVAMVMDDQDSLKEKRDALAQKLTPAAPRELINCLVGLCDKYGLEVEATGLRLAARHASQRCVVAQHGHQGQLIDSQHGTEGIDARVESASEVFPPAANRLPQTVMVQQPTLVMLPPPLSIRLDLDKYEQVDQDGAKVERIVIDCLNSGKITRNGMTGASQGGM